MRAWAGPIGFIAATASLVFWLVVPHVDSGNNVYIHAGNEPIYLAYVALSAAGMLGALIAAVSTRWAALLLALAIIPGIGALLVPGVLLVIVTLAVLQDPEPDNPRLVG